MPNLFCAFSADFVVWQAGILETVHGLIPDGLRSLQSIDPRLGSRRQMWCEQIVEFLLLFG